MTTRLVSVDDTFTPPAAFKVADVNLPANIRAAALSKPIRTQTAAALVASPVDDGGRTACWMDATRTRIFAAYRTTLRYTDDDGATWIDVPGLKITKDIIAVRDLDNGEVLVSSGGVNTQAELWVSTGFRTNPQTATWKKTKTAASPGVFFSNSWSFSVHKNIVLVNEYGPKPGGNGNARYCYMSLDYGQTWKTIYDLGTGTGNHLHGVCYDPYWDRIWLTHGDDTSSILYSDNLGANWSTAQTTTVAAGDFQVVGILALPNCVLFASDGQPNGVLRIPRTAGKGAGTYTPEVAYQIDNSVSLAWLGHLPFRAVRAGDDAPALFPFAPELSTGKSKVLATTDGYTFTVVWEDPISTTSKGAITALGPTARGKLWIVESDDRQANYTKWVGNMPAGY